MSDPDQPPVSAEAHRPVAATLGGLVRPVYLPIVASTFGMGMLIPILPLYLRDGGLGVDGVGLVLAAVGLGAAIGGLPGGWLVDRIGERRLLLACIVVIASTTALVGATTAVIALVALRAATGAANITLRLSRQTFITRHVPVLVRGRAMSLVGGSFRLALLVGPVLGGWLADRAGFSTAFAVAGAVTLFGAIPTWRTDVGAPAGGTDGSPRSSVRDMLSRHRATILRGGVVPLLVMTAREGRYVVIPLIADELGLSAGEIGAVVAVGTAADLALFPVSGWIMDRFGRLHSMVPAFAIIGIGLVLVGIADSTFAVVVGGGIIGVGNGLSAGSMLTLGSDLAPDTSPGSFLAAMAIMGDAGRVVGPLLVGAVAARADLGTAALTLAGVIAAAIAWLALVVGDTSRHALDDPGRASGPPLGDGPLGP